MNRKWKIAVTALLFVGTLEGVKGNSEIVDKALSLGYAEAQPYPYPYPEGKGKTITGGPYVGFLNGLRFNQHTRDRGYSETSGLNLNGTSARNRLLNNRRLVYIGDFRQLFAQRPVYGTYGNVRAGHEDRRRNAFWGLVSFIDDDIDGVDADTTEFQIGWDKLKGRSLYGISLGYADADVDGVGSSEADVDTWSGGLYFSHDANDWYGTAALSYHMHDIEGRDLLVGGGGDADYDADTIIIAGELGKRYGRPGGWGYEPNVSLLYSHTDTDDFTIGGSTIMTDDYNSFRLGLGIRFVRLDPDAKFRPYLFLGYQREFGDDSIDLKSDGIVAVGDGIKLGDDIFTAKLGAKHTLNEKFDLTGEIGGSWRSEHDRKWISAGVRYNW